jgi:hypothetical protein
MLRSASAEKCAKGSILILPLDDALAQRMGHSTFVKLY